MATEPTSDQIREEHAYAIGIQAALWGRPFPEYLHSIYEGVKAGAASINCLTGPDYHGPIPANMTEIKVRTRLAVVANRVFVNSEQDIPAARAVQAGIHMLPLSIFQRQGLKYEIPRSDPAILAFVPTAPEPIRLFEQIGFGMTRFLSASDDYADPMLVLSQRQSRCGESPVERRDQVRAALREGPDPARVGLLEHEHV